jgi:hypothetical protein
MQWSVALSTDDLDRGPEPIGVDAIGEMASVLKRPVCTPAASPTIRTRRLPAPSRTGYQENVERFGAEVVRAR